MFARQYGFPTAGRMMLSNRFRYLFTHVAAYHIAGAAGGDSDAQELLDGQKLVTNDGGLLKVSRWVRLRWR